MENIVSNRIKEARTAKKISVRELAEKVGLTHSTLSRYEKGDIKKLPVENFKKIADSLNVSPVYLLGYTDDKHYTINGNNNIVNTGNNAKTYAGEGNSFTITNTTVEEANPAEGNIDNSIALQEKDNIIQSDKLDLLEELVAINRELLKTNKTILDILSKK